MGYTSFSSRAGSIEVICGCMYSGKSEELIRQLRRAQIAQQNIQVFKPQIDDRYSKEHVASHNQNTFPSTMVGQPYEILHHLKASTQVVGIDEGQFFDDSIVKVVEKLASESRHIILAGLDTDYLGRPFGPMPKLMAVADNISKQHAICIVCGENATRTQRLVSDSGDILVGSHGAYEARCRKHFDPELSARLAQKGQHTEKTQEKNNTATLKQLAFL